MKKPKLIAGILLMILGVGVSIGSVALRYYEHGQYGMMSSGHKIVNRHGMMGGYGFKVRPNQNQNQAQKKPNTNPQPNQNQNNGQNSNGGATQ